MSRLTVVIPVRNEREAIPSLFRRFEEFAPELPAGWGLVLVDGMSTDGTPDLAEEWTGRLPVRVIRLSENRGLGGALETGLLEAIEESDVIVTMDGDDSHDPSTIASMLRKIEEALNS